MARWHSCNVLHTGPTVRRLWQFNARGTDFTVERELAATDGQPLPPHLVAKSWRSLWQPRLNVAVLPPDSVFLRVVQLPESSFSETFSMVELQLEKLSPIPVAQVVWSLQQLPATGDATAAGRLQTVIVILVERKAVEEFLGQLEGQGYLADRLELGALDQLSATTVTEDGAWIYPGVSGGANTALVAWWYGGTLQNLNFLTLPATGDRVAGLKEQLTQMTWAGELEGWLTAPPAWHLVADESAVTEWESPLNEALNELVTVSAPVSAAALAALTAKRATQADPKANLLPPEYAVRYRQQFVDRLWMRGLLAIGAVYMAGVLIYFAALSVQTYRVNGIEAKVKDLGLSYTNAIQLRERHQVLQTRQELKFAALDCWKSAAELLPDTVQLDGFSLVDGRKLTLNGTAPADQVTEVLNFIKAMRKTTVTGRPLFDAAAPDGFNSRMNPGGTTVSWNFGLELKRKEGE